MPLPIVPIPLLYLGINYIRLNRLEEAKAIYRQALERKLDHPYLHADLYLIAFLQNDAAAMKQQALWTAGKLGPENYILALQADTSAYSGRLREARAFSQPGDRFRRSCRLKGSCRSVRCQVEFTGSLSWQT